MPFETSGAGVSGVLEFRASEDSEEQANTIRAGVVTGLPVDRIAICCGISFTILSGARLVLPFALKRRKLIARYQRSIAWMQGEAAGCFCTWVRSLPVSY